MKKIIITAIFLVLLLLATGYLLSINKSRPVPISQSPATTPTAAQTLGGGRDAHGCTGSAGYIWCEPKNKCLRIWEEVCYVSVDQEIQYLLAKKYKKSPAEVKITILKRNKDYVGGRVLFGGDSPGEGGMFLARRFGNMWEVVFDGNGSIDCSKMKQEYGFPDIILKPNFCD